MPNENNIPTEDLQPENQTTGDNSDVEVTPVSDDQVDETVPADDGDPTPKRKQRKATLSKHTHPKREEKTAKPAKELRDEEKDKRAKNRIVRFFIKWAVIAAAIVLVLTFVIGVYPVRGNYMYPAIRDGDLAITWKLGGYAFDDVVSYVARDSRYFARVVAIENDTVKITNQGLLVNGHEPSEDIFYNTAVPEDSPIEKTVDLGHVFVLNDYRDDSNDSRKFGQQKVADLDGKVIFVFRWRGF